jgi:hypothetical protein
MTNITLKNFAPTLQNHLQTVKENHLRKLKSMKERGASKNACYSNFPKAFVDANY